MAGGAQRAEGGRAGALGQAAAGGIGEERMVRVGGLGPSEERLEEAVDGGGGKEVRAAGDEGDALGGVVVGDGEMVARGRFFAAEDDVPEGGGIAGDAGAVLGEGRAGGRGRGRRRCRGGARRGGRRR